MTREEAAAVELFEHSIAHLIEWGLMTRPLAIRWMAECGGVVLSRDQVCSKYGLPEDYFAGDFY
jgi:hypothetical protein